MKSKLTPLLGLAGVIGLVGLSSGCKTVTTTDPGTGATNTVSVPDVKQMQIVAQSAAYLGTTIWLDGLGDGTRVPAHPQDRAKFELARQALKILIAGGTFSAADLKEALLMLPVKELQGAGGNLVIGEAVVLWDVYGRQLANLDKAQVFSTYLLPVAQSILAGLNMALGEG